MLHQAIHSILGNIFLLPYKFKCHSSEENAVQKYLFNISINCILLSVPLFKFEYRYINTYDIKMEEKKRNISHTLTQSIQQKTIHFAQNIHTFCYTFYNKITFYQVKVMIYFSNLSKLSSNTNLLYVKSLIYTCKHIIFVIQITLLRMKNFFYPLYHFFKHLHKSLVTTLF